MAENMMITIFIKIKSNICVPFISSINRTFSSFIRTSLNFSYPLWFFCCFSVLRLYNRYYVWITLFYILVLMFNLFCYSLGIDNIFDLMNQNNEPQNNNNFGPLDNNNPSSHNNGGPPQNNNQLPYHPQTQDDEDRSNPLKFSPREYNEFIRENMVRRLEEHRLSCASNNPYSTRLEDTNLPTKFTSGEHEYICEKIDNYYIANPVRSSGLGVHVWGASPFRIYKGPVSAKLMEIINNSGN